MSIHKRLLCGLLLGLLVLFAVSGGLLHFYVRTVLTRQFDAALAAKAHAVCSLIKQKPDGEAEMDFSAESMPEFGPTGRLDFFQVWQDDGTVLERSPSLGKSDLPRGADVGEGPAMGNIVLADGRAGRSLELQVLPAADEDEKEDDERPRAKPAGAGARSVRVVVAQDRSDLDRTLALLLSAMLLAAAVMVLGTVAIVALVVRRGLRPLGRVAEEAATIDAKSLGFRFSTDAMPGELKPICLRLNDSLRRLEEAFARERRFTADVAHELRTPIAELRCLADVALKWQGDPETAAAYFKDAQDIARQMETVVTTLLALARWQSGSLELSRQPVDVGDVVREAWRGCKDRAASRNLAVSFDVAAPLAVETDRTMLLSVVGNLLSNAVEYATPGGAVVCRAQSCGCGVRLAVTNDNDSLAPDDLPNLFEPFWRKDPARTDSSHSGLGLTLAAAYADVLGAKIEARMPSPRAVSITVDLPVAPQSAPVK